MTIDRPTASRRMGPAPHERIARHPNRYLLEILEQRLLLTAATGHVDIASHGLISGWAYDPDSPTTSISVQITLDGTSFSINANASRPDLVPAIGSANHGFSYNMMWDTPGTHQVVISARDVTGTLTTLSTFGMTIAMPIGFLDSVTPTSVSGWAFDPDLGSNPVDVFVMSNGNPVEIMADQPRPDLTPFLGSPNHGFSVTGSFGVVDVFGATDTHIGVRSPIATTSVKAIGSVDVLNISHVSGWAWTPDLGTTPVTIEVYVDNALLQTATANTSRPDVAGVTGSSNNGFDFALNTVTPGTHTVKIYADDRNSSLYDRVLLQSAVLTNNPPQGSIDVATPTMVSGWVFDKDAGAAPINVDIQVDGLSIAQTSASAPRPDLAQPLGSTAHGFSVVFNTLSAGPHMIDAYAVDSSSGTESRVAVKFIDDTLPFGSLDNADQSTISGWAFDPDMPSWPVQVVAVLDGVRGLPQYAGNPRPDLVPLLGSANHGFSFTTPTNLAGTHILSVIALDTYSNEAVTLGTRQLINQPRGAVDLYSATTVSGWAQDPDAPTTSINMHIRIDGVITQTSASVSRPDLNGFLGSSNHGFILNYAALPTGKHFIEVFGVDPWTGVNTLIGSSLITV